MAKRNSRDAHNDPQSMFFFQKQLSDEEPLTLATARRLYDFSTVLFGLKPWTFLEDYNLIFVQDSEHNSERHCCNVMGALGEVFAMHAYLGEESHRLLRKMLADVKISPDEFFARHCGLSIEFVGASELSAADREFLKYFRHPLGRGIVSPIFRAYRPGYHPWYVTEEEGSILARCMQAVIAFCEILMNDLDAPYWEEPGIYPLLIASGGDGPKRKCTIQQVKVPEPPEPVPVPPPIDEVRLRRILEKDYSMRGALDADHFYSRVVIGKPNERKAILPMAVVTDSQTGFLFQPELGTPKQSKGETLVRGLLAAIESAGFLPREIRVRSKESQTLLDELGRRLGTEVRVVKSLPEADRAKKHLLAMMEGR